MLIFVFLPALRMFLRCDVDVMQFQQNSKQHETFWQVVWLSEEYVLFPTLFQKVRYWQQIE